MNYPLRGALIGCGFVAQHHLAGWRHVPGADLVAVCDLRPERLRWARSIVPEASAYEDAEALFRKQSLDFVEICTRPGPHRALTELATRHGVHVLCQKPVTETREDLLAMIAACNAAGVRLMVHENWRFRPWYRALRTEIESGAVGQPIRLRISHRETRALRPDGFADQPYFAEMPRLILLEMGPHLIDTARYLLGEIATVSATLGHFGEGHPGEDVATLSLRFDSGALGLLDLSWCALADWARPAWALNESAVEGTVATLRLALDGSLERISLDGKVTRRAVPLPHEEHIYLDGYIATQSHFVEGLLHDAPFETSGEETLRTMDVLWNAYRSADEGRTIRLKAQPAP